MQNPLPDPKSSNSNVLKWIEQITENHCGPAVLQMLLDYIGVSVSQEDITEAAGATRTIASHGTRVDQLAKAVNELAPGAKLWYREKSRIEHIQYILDEHRFPVGVEWQGLFGDEDEDDDDYGHYSIISHIDKDKNQLIIVDPYKDFVNQNRIVTINTFVKRWWDFNEVKDPYTRKKVFKKDKQLFFVVAPISVSFPAELQMQSYY